MAFAKLTGTQRGKVDLIGSFGHDVFACFDALLDKRVVSVCRAEHEQASLVLSAA